MTNPPFAFSMNHCFLLPLGEGGPQGRMRAALPIRAGAWSQRTSDRNRGLLTFLPVWLRRSQRRSGYCCASRGDFLRSQASAPKFQGYGLSARRPTYNAATGAAGFFATLRMTAKSWIPAFAEMTKFECARSKFESAPYSYRSLTLPLHPAARWLRAPHYVGRGGTSA
jgi:hypothetical protein